MRKFEHVLWNPEAKNLIFLFFKLWSSTGKTLNGLSSTIIDILLQVCKKKHLTTIIYLFDEKICVFLIFYVTLNNLFILTFCHFSVFVDSMCFCKRKTISAYIQNVNRVKLPVAERLALLAYAAVY